MRYALLIGALATLTSGLQADEKPTLQAKLITKETTLKLDTGGKTADEYKKMMANLADKAKKEPGLGATPKPPAVDFSFEITNTGKEKVTIYVAGDPNVFTMELKGPSVVTLTPNLAVTADFRLPRAVVVEPGKSYSIPVKQLSDGMRGIGRYVYPTEAGEYTLTASYQLTNQDGEKTTLIAAEAVKLKVELKK